MFSQWWQIFKPDILENEASYEQALFHTFFLFFRKESLRVRLHILCSKKT